MCFPHPRNQARSQRPNHQVPSREPPGVGVTLPRCLGLLEQLATEMPRLAMPWTWPNGVPCLCPAVPKTAMSTNPHQRGRTSSSMACSATGCFGTNWGETTRMEGSLGERGSARGGHLTLFSHPWCAPATLRCRRRRRAWAMVVGGKREPASDSQLADVGPCSSVLGSELGPFLGGLGVWGDDGCGVRLQRWCGVAVQLGRVVLQSFPPSRTRSTIGYNGRGMWWSIA